MDGEAFRVGGHFGSSHPSAAAMEDPMQSQNQFLFNARPAPLQLQLFGSPAGKIKMDAAPVCFTRCCVIFPESEPPFSSGFFR
jgi:hypothetical protein